MANETLSIQKDDARLTVIGKSKADVYINSGLGLDLGDLDIGSLDPFDLNWQIDVPDPNNLPDEIRIITMPTKTEYKDGEKIDFSGAVVGAYKNNSIWTSAKYPNGHIPLSELFISPLIAKSDLSPSYDDLIAESTFPSSMDKSKVKIYSPGSEFISYYGVSYIYRGSIGWECKSAYTKANDGESLCIIADFAEIINHSGNMNGIEINDDYYIDGSFFVNPDDYPLYINHSGNKHIFSLNYMFFTTSNNGMNGLGTGSGASKDEAVNTAINAAKPGSSYTCRYDYSKDGKTVFFPNFGFDYYDRNLIGDIAWKVLYGDYGGYPVTVAWERPGDRIVLSTSFKVSLDDSL